MGYRSPVAVDHKFSCWAPGQDEPLDMAWSGSSNFMLALDSGTESEGSKAARKRTVPKDVGKNAMFLSKGQGTVNLVSSGPHRSPELPTGKRDRSQHLPWMEDTMQAVKKASHSLFETRH